MSRYLLVASSTFNSAKKVLTECGHIELMDDKKKTVADLYFPRYLRGD